MDVSRWISGYIIGIAGGRASPPLKRDDESWTLLILTAIAVRQFTVRVWCDDRLRSNAMLARCSLSLRRNCFVMHRGSATVQQDAEQWVPSC